MMSLETDTLLTFAINLAKRAGEIQRKHYFDQSLQVETKSDATPLTIADTAINSLVLEKIQKTYPTHSVMGEEESSKNMDSDYLWICDPIDGTIPFSHHIPTFAFSLALYRDKKPMLGVVYDPISDRMLYAVEGGPAYCNGKVIKIPDEPLKFRDLVVIGEYTAPDRSEGFEASRLYRYFAANGFWIHAHHSIVYNCILVALGFVKAYISNPAYSWDRAAVSIILRAAGGILADENGNEAPIFTHPNFIVASSKRHVGELAELGRKFTRYGDLREDADSL